MELSTGCVDTLIKAMVEQNVITSRQTSCRFDKVAVSQLIALGVAVTFVIAGVGGLDVKNVQLGRKIEAGMKEMNPKIEAGNAHGKYETARLKQETPRTLGRFDDGAEGSIAAKKSKNWFKWGYLQVRRSFTWSE